MWEKWIGSMLPTLLPIALSQIANMPLAEKRVYADKLAMLADTFVDCDSFVFEGELSRFEIPPDLRAKLVNALYCDENQGK